MIHNKFFIFILVFFTFSIPAFSQEKEKQIEIDIGLKAGWFGFQESPFTGIYNDNNWTVAAEFIVWFSNGFGVGGEVEYFRKSSSYDLNIPFITRFSEVSHLPLNINGYYRFNTAVSGLKPYLGGGFSYIRTSSMTEIAIDVFEIPFTGSVVSTSNHEWTTGFTVFAGSEFRNFIVEFQYLWAESDYNIDDILELFTTDFNIGGYSVLVGYRF